ncbi:MAG: hypothetical protein GTO18_03680 [Anaerolineales bacterium]|nr:hypothetical protein [Anaerolineales bacterium]
MREARGALNIVLGSALVIRLLVLVLSSVVPDLQTFVVGGDAIGYEQLARNLFLHRAFMFDDGDLTSYRMPGYPLFLALTYVQWNTPLPAQLVQILADVITIFAVYLIGMQISKLPVVSLLAASAIALNPVMIVSSVSLYPDTLATAFVIVAMIILLKNGKSRFTGLLASVLLAAGIYMKPSIAIVSLALILAFALYRIMRFGRSYDIAYTLIMQLLIILFLLSPWIIRNHIVMDAIVPLTTSTGNNLFGGNNPQADGGYVSSEPYVLTNTSEIESDRIFTNRAFSWIRSNPGDFVRLLPAKILRLMSLLSLGTSGYLSVPDFVARIVGFITVSFYLLVLIGGIQVAASKHPYEGLILIAAPAAIFITTLMTFGASRFLLPGFPTLAVLASIGLEAAWSKLKVMISLSQSPSLN